MTKIIDGKLIALQRLQRVKECVSIIKTNGIIPHLAIVTMLTNEATKLYVTNKTIAARKIGILTTIYEINELTTQEELSIMIQSLNRDESVHGIIIQMPMPQHIDKTLILNTVATRKDVDGFTYVNQGKLLSSVINVETFIPGTALGVLASIKDATRTITGKDILMIGTSIIVGKPVASLLMYQNATVTIANSKTQNLKQKCLNTDIIVTAAGQPNLIKEDMISEKTIIIDVGISKVFDTNLGRSKIVGDVDFDTCSKIAEAITPVPGGIGPLTVAFLLQNVVCASAIQSNIGVAAATELASSSFR